MSVPYIYYAGNPDCPHDDVALSSLTMDPPITEWVCKNPQCGRRVRRNQDPTKTTMPEVKQLFDPDKYPYAKMKLEGDWLYRSDYVHGEDEEIPEEFAENDDLARAFNKHQWWRLPGEVRFDMKYNLSTGRVELLAVDGKTLAAPLVLMP